MKGRQRTEGRAAPKDVHEAFRATVYAQERVEDLAALMGLSPGVLYNKANCNDTSHNQPTARDLVVAQVVTGDKRITHAMAACMGGVFVDLAPLRPGNCDQAILDLVAAWMKEQGEVFARFEEAYGDGKLDAQDVKRIKAEAYDVLRAVLEFVRRVEAMQS